jgi:hypothetical protein
MSAATCAYPGCARPATRTCDRCRRAACDRHIAPMYPDVVRSPYRCTLCAREARQEAHSHRQRSPRRLIPAGLLILLGAAILIIGTALAPDSDRITFAGIGGMLLVGIGLISLCYALFAS